MQLNIYLEEAKAFSDDTDKIALLSLRLMEKDKDKEKDIEIMKVETKYLQREALWKSELAAMTQRYIIYNSCIKCNI
jgi:uncharacterized protein YihD (DUF1040 family)